MKSYIFLFILIINFTGCSTKDDYILFNQAQASKKEMVTDIKNVEFEYKIQAHDRVSVIVYNHPELSTANLNSLQQERGLLINSKGNIRLALVKSVHLAGLTQTEAEKLLSEKFSVYLKHPDIQIEVLSKRAYVIGEVKNPGEIELINERLTLLQILAKAGDLTDTADRQSILIFKGGDTGKLKSRVVNLTDIHSLQTSNLMIYPNDIVYVMPNDMKAFNTNVNEIRPVFNLINSVLAPFVNIKFLSN